MNKNYNFIFLQNADAWESVTPNTVEIMFERAENTETLILCEKFITRRN